ncbi:MAG: YciI family protein [Gemmatimonadales bacterium]|nr:YciI family protein [Gemmatimonadales bacterium]
MHYAILIYGCEGGAAAELPPADYQQYNVALATAGVMRGGARLAPTDTATSVRTRGGRRTVVDGPAVVAAEQLAGFYLIDVPDLDAALEWAARCPGAAAGTVEVRSLPAASLSSR